MLVLENNWHVAIYNSFKNLQKIFLVESVELSIILHVFQMSYLCLSLFVEVLLSWGMPREGESTWVSDGGLLWKFRCLVYTMIYITKWFSQERHYFITDVEILEQNLPINKNQEQFIQHKFHQSWLCVNYILLK